METKRTLRIVVASPSDVQRERDVLPTVIDEINRGIAADRDLRIELSRWETDSYPGFHADGPQGLIDPLLRISDCDVLIGIFWKRFGTPAIDAESGTEHEILLAYNAWRETGRPQIMVYFNDARFSAKSEDERNQYQKLLAFRKRFPKEGLFWSYHGMGKFERLVRNHLTQFIRHEYPRANKAENGRHLDAGRAVSQLLQIYSDSLKTRLSRLYVVGDPEVRELEKVFVKLSVTAEYKRPSSHLRFLGLMDAEMRRRRDVLAETEDDDNTNEKSEAMVHPDTLLRQGTQAVITGAPGCGKTTLLKYLALQNLGASGLILYIELKTLTEAHFTQAQNELAELLFERGLSAGLHLQALERERLKAHFVARLAAGEAAIYLDGLDEVRSMGFFPVLCTMVSEFVRGEYRKNTVVVSTRPYALQTRLEGFNEMEIAPLNREQIEEFLEHYYCGDVVTKALLLQLRRNSGLRELCRVPFLLSVIAQLHRTEQQIVNDQLEIYRQIVVYLGTKLDKEKSLALSAFHITDPDGTLKLDFLRDLACERLMMGYVNDQLVTEEATRLVFSGNILTEHAKRFLEKEKRPEINPRLLAADVKATPLLREVGNDIYAFAHLTIQEYLAAAAIAAREDCTQVYSRAYFNTTLAAMEVLPMTLGLVRKPEALYEAVAALPESLTWNNFRLRARGLGYAPQLLRKVLQPLTQRVIDFAGERNAEETPYASAVLSSLTYCAPIITDSIAALLQDEDVRTRMSIVQALGQIGGEKAVKYLCEAVNDVKGGVRWLAVEALGAIGDESAECAVVQALKDQDKVVRLAAAEALCKIGGPAAVNGLLEVLSDSFVENEAARALARIASSQAQEALLTRMNDDDKYVRRDAAQALGWMKNDVARKALEDVLNDESSLVRREAAEALGRIGADESVPLLAPLLNDSDDEVRWSTAWALQEVGSNRAVVVLVDALSSKDDLTRWSAGVALGNIRTTVAVDAAAGLLSDPSPGVRWRVATTLAKYADSRAITALIDGLKDPDMEVRWRVAAAMHYVRGENVLEALIEALNDESSSVRSSAAGALAHAEAKPARRALLRALTDENKNVRASAAYALGYVGGEEGFAALLGAAHDEHDYVRGRAVEALGRLREPQAVGTLLEALRDEINSVRASAANALEQIGSSGLATGLKQALSHQDHFVRRKAVQVVGYYAQELDVLDSLARMAATDRIGEVRNAATAERLKYERKLQLFGF